MSSFSTLSTKLLLFHLLKMAGFFRVHQINVRGAISSWISDFVGKDGTFGFLAEIHAEFLIQLHAAVLMINVDLQHHGAVPVTKEVERLVGLLKVLGRKIVVVHSLGHFRIKLFVPWGK